MLFNTLIMSKVCWTNINDRILCSINYTWETDQTIFVHISEFKNSKIMIIFCSFLNKAINPINIFHGTIRGRTVADGDTTDVSPPLSMAFRRAVPKPWLYLHIHTHSGKSPQWQLAHQYVMIHVLLVKHYKPLISTNHYI